MSTEIDVQPLTKLFITLKLYDLPSDREGFLDIVIAMIAPMSVILSEAKDLKYIICL